MNPSKLLSSLLAFSIGVAPVAASADQYIFRYRQPVSELPVPPAQDVEYGIGNDIVAYFVAPAGYDFSKRIPVATRDVVEWHRDSGAVPAGIDLDVATGLMSGKPAQEEQQSTLWHGYDAAGNRIARAEMHFTVFEPVGVPSVVDFYTHTNTYFYGEIPDPEGVEVHTWVPVDGVVYPDGMSMMNSAFQGTPTVAGQTDLAWRGFDYLGREVAFAYGDILVADGPLVEEVVQGGFRTDFGSQTKDKSKSEFFSIEATVREALGAVTYRLVPETVRPAGVNFSSAEGLLGGVYNDFETTATFRIEARDSYDGTTGLSTPFTLTTLPSVADLSSLEGTEFLGTVGIDFYRQFSARGVLPGAKWEIVSGTLPDGLEFDAEKGRITGTPLKAETQGNINIRVSGPAMTPAEGGPFSIRIQSEAISAYTTPLEVRIGKPFETAGVTVSGGVSEGYSVSTKSTLSSGLSLDAETGVIAAPSGVGEVGEHNAYLWIENKPKDRWTGAWQSIKAYNPLNIAYENMTVERRRTVRQLPQILPWTTIGETRYSIEPAPPSWMIFNRNSGLITLNPVEASTEGTHGPFTVTITDSTKESQPSEPFTVEVAKRPELETVINDKDAERFIQNGYRLATAEDGFGRTTFAMTTVPSNWPSTLRLTAEGWLAGTTTDPVGTVYPGIVITATDGEGVADPSEPFDLTVVEPAGLGGLYGPLSKTVTWTKDKSFSGVLPPLRNGFGKITYSFDPPIPGVNFSDASTGAFTGTIGTAGKTTHTFTIDDETDRPAAVGTLTLDIREPLDASGQGDVSLNRAAYFQPQTVPAFTGGAEPFTYSLQGNLPEGMTYLNGKLYGTPKEEGDFPVVVTVTDKTGDQTTASFTLKVSAPLPFKLSYAAGDLYVGESGQHGVLKVPSLENAMPNNTSVTWGQPLGTLPPGVNFTSGRFTGMPTEAGRYTVTVDATDGEGRPASATVELVVTLRGVPSFEPQTFRIRAGSNTSKTLDVANAVAPLEFTSSDPAGMPHNLVLNASTGSVTGQFDTAGIYSAGVTVKDSMDREASSTVTFEVVGNLSVSTSGAMLKQYEAAKATPEVAAENTVGTMSYALVAGTLPANVSVDTSTGAIVGTSDEFGTWSGLVIEGTDEDGATARTEEFTLTVEQRAPLALEAPAELPLKRFSTASFAAKAKDAIPPVRFEVSPVLPAGLTLDADTGSITGSSDQTVPETVYTLKVVDSKGGDLGTDIASFTLKVDERDKLDISVADVPAKRYSDVDPVTVKVASGTAIGAVAYVISPSLPDGLQFINGVISGRPTGALEATTYTVSATDEKGGELGSDDATFTLSIADRDALGIDGPASFEFPQYFAAEVAYQAVAPIEGATFRIDPALPEGLELDASTGLISGTAVEKMPATKFTLTVEDAYDSFDRTITLAVGDRKPLGFVTPAAQSVFLGSPYTLTLETENLVGDEVTWEHVSGDLPAGIEFDAATGTFSGAATEFGVVSNVTIRATDAFDGSADRTFVFTVIQDGTPITLTAAGGKTRMGYAFDIAAPSAENVVGDFWYEVSGLEGTGLAVNRKTGQLEGTAAYAFEKDVTIAVKDVTGRGAEQTVKLVSAPAMTVTAQATVPMVYNYAPDAEKVTAPEVTNSDGTVAWTYTGTLPDGVSVNPATGAFAGVPKQLGTFGPITLVAADSLPGTASSNPVTIAVTMNEDPIELAVEPFTTKIGYEVSTSLPVYDNHLGEVTFFSTDLPAGMSLDAKTGVLSGTATELLDRNVNISVRDTDTLRVTSRPLQLKVIPLMQITVPQQVPVLALTDIAPITPNRQYVVGAATWEPVDESVNKLPEGIVFDTAAGSFRGNAKELGTFGPFTVASTDSLGDRGVSNSFTIKVTPGTHFVALAAADLPDGVKRIEEYRYDLTQHLTNVGMDVSELTWTLGAGSPPGLALTDGVLSGTPSQSGEFAFDVTVSYGSVSAIRGYSIKVELPETELTLADGSLASGKTRKDYTASLSELLTLKNIPEEDVAWVSSPEVTLGQDETAGLPPGISLTGSGGVSGKPTLAGRYRFKVSASWEDLNPAAEAASDEKTYLIVIEGVAYSFSHLAAGNSSTCGLMDGKAYCWGNNSIGQLGDGTYTQSSVPVEVADLGAARALSGYANHYCAVTSDGSVWCWGQNGYGQLGDGVAGGSANRPVKVVGLPQSAAKVAVGNDHSCAVLTDGSAWCWGYNNWGNLGDGTKISRATAGPVYGLTSGVAGVTAGRNHSCAVLSDGSARCWGVRNQGAMGDGTSSGQALQPVQPTGLSSGVVSIVSGNAFNCALMNGGAVKCWGYNSYGQLGIGSTERTTAPVTTIGSGVVALSSNDQNVCATTSLGEMLCWGDNTSRQTGQDGNAAILVPTPVPGVEQASTPASGGAFTCAVIGGKPKCWGSNSSGQLGNGSTVSTRFPTEVAG